MRDEDLRFTDLLSETAFRNHIFNIRHKQSAAANGYVGDYYVADAKEWVVVLAFKEDHLMLVRQWRHGYGGITTELPGGTVDAAEAPEHAARRELEEEIAHRAGKMTYLGTVNPNPALFTNRFHVFLAEDLIPLEKQTLDEDEFIEIVEKPFDEVLTAFGTGEYIHAFMGTALALYFKYEKQKAEVR